MGQSHTEGGGSPLAFCLCHGFNPNCSPSLSEVGKHSLKVNGTLPPNQGGLKALIFGEIICTWPH